MRQQIPQIEEQKVGFGVIKMATTIEDRAIMEKDKVGFRYWQARVRGMMWIALVLLFSISCFVGQAAANGGEEIWSLPFQDVQTGLQEARASVVDAAGNLIITGYADVTGSGDDNFYTIKISSDGQTVLWTAVFDLNGGSDWGEMVAVDGNGNVVVTGYGFNGINDDIITVAYDGLTGSQLWVQVYNDPSNANDYPNGMTLDSSGNVLVAGYSQSGGIYGDEAILYKLEPLQIISPSSPPKWVKNVNITSGGNDRFTDIVSGTAGIAVTGYTSKTDHGGGADDYDYLTALYDDNGTLLWQETYDHGYGSDEGRYVDFDSAGNVIVAGKALAAGNQEDMVTLKYPVMGGAFLWMYSHSAGSPNIPVGLVVGPSDDVYLAGYTFTSSGLDDYYAARYASLDGHAVWERVYDTGTNNNDSAEAIALDGDGGLYVTGFTDNGQLDSDFLTVKFNGENGNIIWSSVHGSQGGGNEQTVGVAVGLGVGADGHVYAAGWTQSSVDINDLDYYAVKYDSGFLNRPTDLTGILVNKNMIDLAWQDNSNNSDPAKNEDNFCIQRCTSYGCDFSTVDFTDCTIAANNTTYSDASVLEDTWYSYRVYGQNTVYGPTLTSNIASEVTTKVTYDSPTWVYLYDRAGLNDAANAIAMGPNDNPVATGVATGLNSQDDYFTVKFDRTNAGAPLWTAIYDGVDGQGDNGICLDVDSNGNVVVSGFSSLPNTQGINTNDIFTIKYDVNGPAPFTGYPLWTDQYNGPGNDSDRSEAIATAADGSNFSAVVGYGKNLAATGNNDIYLIKYKPDYDGGSQQVWAITPYDSGYNDYPAGLIFDGNGDVIVVGKSYNANGNTDILVNKYNGDNGTQIIGQNWPYTLDYNGGNDGVNAVTVDAQGNIYVVGFVTNVNGDLDWYLNKFDGAGNPLWGPTGKIIDGGINGRDIGMAIGLDINDGNVVAAGSVTSITGSLDFHLLRLNSAGTEMWQKTLDRSDQEDNLVGMAISTAGDICLVGDTDSGVAANIIAVKYDNNGAILGATNFDNGYEDHATSITVNKMGEFFVAGSSETGPLASDDKDFLVFKFEGDRLQAPSPFLATPHYTTVDLSWTINDPSVEYYVLNRKDGACIEGGTIFSGPSNTLIYGDIDLFNSLSYTDDIVDGDQGKTFCYGLQAKVKNSSVGSRILEKQVSTNIPTPPTLLSVTALNSTDVEVCWQDNTSNENYFGVERCSGAACDFSGGIVAFPAAGMPNESGLTSCYIDTSACDTAVAKTYRYRVTAYNNQGVVGWLSSASLSSAPVITPSLGQPSSLGAVMVTDAEVDLQWFDGSNDETEFVIERCEDVSGNGSGCTNFGQIGYVSSIKSNVLLLEMDESSWNGTIDEIVDYSGNAQHGTSWGGALISSEAHKGNSAELDGIDDYITTSLSIEQSATSAGVTMMAWVKPSSLESGDHFLFSTENAGVTQENRWGVLRSGANWAVVNGTTLQDTGVVADDTNWHHIAVVFSPTGIRFYLDGVETSLSGIAFFDTTGTLTIGRQGDLAQNYFDGLVDEAAVYNRPLSTVEINKIKNRGIFPEATGEKWFTDDTPTVNTIYNYQIRAKKVIDCGTGLDYSMPSNAISVTTVPAPLSTLQADIVDPGHIMLSWIPSTITQTGYQVERCNGAGCTDFSVIDGSVPGGAINYLDSTLCFGADGVVRYQIKTLGSWGATPAGNMAEVVIPSLSSPLTLTFPKVTESQIDLSWTAEDSGRDGFRVLRCLGLGCTPSLDVVGYPMDIYSDSSLQALWKMDETGWDDNSSTLEIRDSSGNGHHANASGGAKVTTDSKSGYGAAYFDGVDDYINTGLSIDQSETTTGVTFEAWVKPFDDGISRYHFVMSTSNNGNDYDLGLSNHGNGYWYVDSGYTRTYSAVAVDFGQWQHMVLVYDLSGVKLYRNGVLAYSTNAGVETNDLLTIGQEGPLYTGSRFFGEMDDVAVYNRVLDPQEIAAHYNNGGLPVRTVNFSDTDNIIPGADYTYRVFPHKTTACNDYDSSAGYLDGNVTSVMPLPPTDFGCVADDTTTVSCTWTPLTSSETNYRLERCYGTSCSFSLLDDGIPAGAFSYSDGTLCQNSQDSYRLRAEKSGDSDWPTAWSATTIVTTPASVAPVLDLTVVSESEIDLSWDDPNLDENSLRLSFCDGNATRCANALNYNLLLAQSGTDKSMLFHYKMDEADWLNTPIIDSSESGNDGVAFYGVTTVVSDKPGFGMAGYFDGTGDHIQTTLMLDETATGPGATFEVWIKPAISFSTYYTVLSTENGGYDWGIFHLNGYWYVSDGVGRWNTGVPVDLNQWQHIAAVFAPGVGVKFYKNGNEVVSSTIGFDISVGNVFVGRQTNSSYYFNGLMDEFVVYTRPLSSAEILDHSSNVVGLGQYSHTGLTHSSSYYYTLAVDKSVPSGCSWHQESSANGITPAPPPPTALAITCNTTTCDMLWQDNNGSETGYIVERCDGNATTCGTSIATLGAGTESYQDDQLQAGQTYTYSVYAVGAWGATSPAQLTVQTDTVPATPILNGIRRSEVELELSWNYIQADESALKLERCLGIDCSEVLVTAGDQSYLDNELAANNEYCYRLALYKSGSGANGWQSAWSNSLCLTTDTSVVSDLSAVSVDTTTIALTWSSETITETNTIVERCAGSPASCNDASFVQVGAALNSQNGFVDTITPLPLDCYNREYSYRLKEIGGGLSNDGGGCWSARAPITFTSFMSFSPVEINISNSTVNYPEMQADFSDIRFFDATANRELPVYWIKDKVDGDHATVWLMTGANDDIYIYYGNTSALVAGTTSAAFTEVYDDFQGSVIDTGKWLESDTNGSGYDEHSISQNNGLVLVRQTRAWSHSLISTKTFGRATGDEIYFDFTTGEHNISSLNRMAIGWEKDQTTDPAQTQLMHGLYMNGYYANWYFQVLENGLEIVPDILRYTPNTYYEAKVILQDAGAQYYIKGGVIPDWTLVHETNTSFGPDDQVLRLGILNMCQNAVIHSIKVLHASAQGGALVGAPEVPVSGGCWVFSHTWQGSYSNVVSAITNDIITPANLQVSTTINEGVAELTWDDNNTDETGYKIERCCGPSCTYTEIGRVDADILTYGDSATPESLDCNYQVAAYKDGSCPWDSLAVQTAQQVSSPAPIPSNFTAIPINAFQIDLSWDDVLGEDGYLLEMEIFNGKWVPVTTLLGNVNHYVDTSGINPGTSYRYRLCSLRNQARSIYVEAQTTTATPIYDGNATTCTMPNP